MKTNLKVVLTGGGTAGHVMLHLALLPLMLRQHWDITYIGSAGIEKKLIEEAKVRFVEIRAGKLRRYFSFKNFFDIFNVGVGFIQALIALILDRPQVVFSKGGYVAVPVVLAAWVLRIPVVAHESDYTPGLATKISAKFAKKLLYTFPETKSFLPKNSAEWVGAPIRQSLLTGKKAEGLKFCGFDANDTRPILLVMGGSQGAQKLNQLIEQEFNELIKSFRIIHLTGKGKQSGELVNSLSYRAFEYLGVELSDVLAATDFVIARAGANSIFEFLYLNKPMLLIPLEEGSRGDQVHNAQSFVSKGWAMIVRESELDSFTFLLTIRKFMETADDVRLKQKQTAPDCSPERVLSVLSEVCS